MKLFFSVLGKCKRLFWSTFIISIIFCTVSVITPNVSGRVVDQVLDRVSKPDIQRGMIVFLGVCILQMLFSVWNDYAQKKFVRSIKKEMRSSAFCCFSKKINLKRDEIASFTSFVNNDIPCITEQYCLGVLDIASCICLLVCTSLSLFSVHWVLAFVIIAISLLIVYLPKLMRDKASDSRKNYAESLSGYNTHMESYLKGVNVIRAYNYHKRANQFMEQNNSQVEQREGEMSKYQVEVQSITTVLQIAKTFFVFLCGIFLINCGEIKVGDLVIALQLAGNIGAPIEVLAYALHSRNEAKPLVDKYIEIIEYGKEQNSEKGFEKLPLSEIAVNNLSYEIDGVSILHDLSMKFQAGKKYMICGKSGSGKSTLLRLLSQMNDDTYSGVITVDGRDIRDIDPAIFHREISIVFQEPYLFWTTLEENILLGRDISKERFDEVMTKLNIGYLMERFKGKEINVEMADTLSGGEKQRIALARAILGRPQVYLLDEATSALDNENTYVVEKMLLEEDAMIIHVSHKPVEELKNRYDKIISFV